MRGVSVRVLRGSRPIGVAGTRGCRLLQGARGFGLVLRQCVSAVVLMGYYVFAGYKTPSSAAYVVCSRGCHTYYTKWQRGELPEDDEDAADVEKNDHDCLCLKEKKGAHLVELCRVPTVFLSFFRSQPSVILRLPHTVRRIAVLRPM